MKKNRLLLVSVFGPYGHRDKYAEGTGMQMELLNNQITRQQGVHSPRQSYWSFPLYLLAENISVPTTVLDFPKWDDFTRELEKGYTHVGITFIIPNVLKAKRMAEHIRSHHPRITIILGGYGTMLPDLENTVPHDEICDKEGVSWLRQYFGEDASAPVVHPAIRGPAYEYIYGYRGKTKGAVLLTGVGCNNACEFCATSHKFGKEYMPLLSTGEEIFEACLRSERELRSRGFAIIDENFLKQPVRARELLALMEQHGKAYVFSIFSSAEVTVRMGVDFLVRLGVHIIWIGVESKSNVHAKMKGIRIKELVRELQDHGIVVNLSAVLFLDHHDPVSIQEDIDWTIDLGSDMTQFMNYTPYPCTALYSRLEVVDRLKDIHYRYHHGAGELNWHHPFMTDPGDHVRILRGAFRKKYEKDGPAVANMALTAIRGYSRVEADHRHRQAESMEWNMKTLRYEKNENPHLDEFMRMRIRRMQKIAKNIRPILLPALAFAPNWKARKKMLKVMRLYQKTLGWPSPRVILESMVLVFTGIQEQFRLWSRRLRGYEDIVYQPPTRWVNYRNL